MCTKAGSQKRGICGHICHASAKLHVQEVHLHNPVHVASGGHSRDTKHRDAATNVHTTQLGSFSDVADTRHAAISRQNSAVIRQTLPV
eukprot:CAMPEP_0168396668 /NCGR_PEP_ID=MMETSP0228-20121227/20670_1 /TAXON_ID=133427 /ORGANISM="Protoceratium reticulatum, Strain CCCM 535 (=CCMP 1889)" /LENGTH=87 /DNA_ID=CAMNT_0008410123 /DNA_START=163 /DNA_END=427 /DNA_ORIENTATION=+